MHAPKLFWHKHANGNYSTKQNNSRWSYKIYSYNSLKGCFEFELILIDNNKIQENNLIATCDNLESAKNIAILHYDFFTINNL